MRSKSKKSRCPVTAAFAQVVLGVSVCSAANAALSSISNITLYPGGATIERRVQVPVGSTRIEVFCLPASFDSQSLRLIAPPDIELGDFRIDDTEESDGKSDLKCASTVRDQRIQALQEKLASLNARAEAVELSAGYLKKVSEDSADAGSKSALTATSRSLEQSGYEVFTQRDQIRRQKDEAQRQLDALQRDGGEPVATRALRVALSAPRGGQLTISYDTQRAGWIPAYQASLDSSNGTLTLERRALVAQATGEDWRGVKLRLSSSTPARNTRAPQPFVWQLQLSEPRLQQSMPIYGIAAPAPAPALFRPDPNAPLFAPMQIEGTFLAQFEIPGEIEVPSDAQKTGFTLAKESLPVKLSARALPRESTQAWLIAKAARPQGVWPDGDVQLRRDGEQVGSTRWSGVVSNDELTFPFGPDEQVSVSKADGPDSTGAVKVSASTASKTISTRYSVKNLHRSPIDVEILESSPISESPDLDVTVAFNPKPDEVSWEGRQGIVAWRRFLSAGEGVSVGATYTVRYPRDRTVYGLP